ncbi:IPT/TIG domain-containing protein [Tieghemostelium lacteum]|uniref:IPT/TIG domain-containing protein n=1 Tax=Tieghemostelium lacteum TaxID=361077 RepID=A0A151Z6V1_TIELA|nr:IPT/TIG domain-containing protein [Tieghemostelium lacteum]|eukprot:KYQ89689.1 IPT/TIG domain-containing protein [Tieghemostelium lacteum]
MNYSILVFILYTLLLYSDQCVFSFKSENTLNSLTLQLLSLQYNCSDIKYIQRESSKIIYKRENITCNPDSVSLLLEDSAISEDYTIYFNNNNTLPLRDYVFLKPIQYNLNDTTKIGTNGGKFQISFQHFSLADSLFSVSIRSMGKTLVYNSNSSKLILTKDRMEISIPEGVGTFQLKFYFGRITNCKECQSQYLIEVNQYYNTPIINSIENDEKYLYINGEGFGSNSKYMDLFIDGIRLNNLYLVSFVHNQIKLYHNIDKSKKITLELKIAGQSPQLSIIEYQFTPILQSITQSFRGEYITLTGYFLDVNPFLLIQIGNYLCINPRNPINGNFQFLQCLLVQGQGENLQVNITVDGKPSKSKIYFTFSPLITKIESPNNDGYLTISGESFGNINQSTIVFNDIEYSDLVSTSDKNLVIFRIPPSPLNGDIQIQFNGRKSNYFNYEFVPIIQSISGSSTQGGLITITGKYLRILDSVSNNLFTMVYDPNDPSLQCINLYEDPSLIGNQLYCQLTSGTGNHSIQIAISKSTSKPFQYSYNPPLITEQSQFNRVGIIEGMNFGNNIDRLKLYYNGQLYSNNIIKSISHNILSFEIPELARSGALYVVIDGQKSNQINFTVNPFIDGYSSVPTNGGILTIFGGYFVPDFYKQMSIMVGNVSCLQVKITHPSSIECLMPSGSGKNYTFTFLNQTDNNATLIQNFNNIKFSYERPRVVAISSVGLEGGYVTIDGTSFNTPISIQVGDRQCQNPLVINYSQAICYLSPYEKVPNDFIDVIVNVNEVIGISKLFKYIEDKDQAVDIGIQVGSNSNIVAAIVIPVVIVSGIILIFLVFIIQRYRRLKKLIEEFKK